MNSFKKELVKTINENMYNYYIDNYDNQRFGCSGNNFKDYIKFGLSKLGLYNRSISLKGLCNIADELDHLEQFYSELKNEESKKLLIVIFAYRILGHRKIKLPIDLRAFRHDINEIENIKVKKRAVDSGFKHYVLNDYDLRPIKIPIRLYFTALGIWHTFVARQYEYKQNGNVIKAIEGDVVLDCGGCWGDTALYFANEVGAGGKVFSFEFIPSNIILFKKNVLLNPGLSERIVLEESPVWSEPGKLMHVLDNGPSSKISLKPAQNTTTVFTQTIDVLVSKSNLERVDFIKMDIEGAELNALQGGIETIKKFRPKLAIAVYHNVSDFYNIPFWIRELNLGYKFYLGHYSIHHEETILFAET